MDHCDFEEDNYLGNKVFFFFLFGMNTEIVIRIFTELLWVWTGVLGIGMASRLDLFIVEES